MGLTCPAYHLPDRPQEDEPAVPDQPPTPPPGPPPALRAVPPPRPRFPAWAIVVITVAAVLLLGGLMDLLDGPDPAPMPAATLDQPAATAAPAAPTTARPRGIGDGTWRVPAEVRPGTYRTEGANTAEGRSNCYWARLGALSGDTDDILANGNTTGPASVTITRGDRGFASEGCQPWQPVRTG
jgi:hypothetical protein